MSPELNWDERGEEMSWLDYGGLKRDVRCIIMQC